MAKFKIGDTVRLKSGGLTIIIESAYSSEKCRSK